MARPPTGSDLNAEFRRLRCRFRPARAELAEIAAAAQSGAQPGGFEAFLQAYFRRLSAAIAEAVGVENRSRQERERYGGKPLQSVFTGDCIERGLDIDRGGARYNWIECSFVGLANLVDSLEVIRNEVFELRALTLAQLRAALLDHWDRVERNVRLVRLRTDLGGPEDWSAWQVKPPDPGRLIPFFERMEFRGLAGELRQKDMFCGVEGVDNAPGFK